MSKSKSVGICFSNENYDKIKVLADKQGVSVSQIVNEIVSKVSEVELKNLETIRQNNESLKEQNFLKIVEIAAINKIGNNINQIAKVLNFARKNDKMSEYLFSESQKVLGKYFDELKFSKGQGQKLLKLIDIRKQNDKLLQRFIVSGQFSENFEFDFNFKSLKIKTGVLSFLGDQDESKHKRILKFFNQQTDKQKLYNSFYLFLKEEGVKNDNIIFSDYGS